MSVAVQELERRVIQARSAPDCLAALLALAHHHAGAFRNREGLRCAREALNIARARNDKLAIGRALSTATICHYQRGAYLSAVATGLDAVEAYADGDLRGRSSAFQSISLSLFAVEAYALAEQMAQRAIADAVTAEDPAREAASRSVWGMILADRGRFDAARRQFRLAAVIHRAGGEIVKLKKSACNLAHAYRKQGIAAEAAGETPRARIFWRHAIRVYRIALATGASDADDAIAHGAIAECECRLGNAQGAHRDALRAVDLAGPVRSAVVLAPCHLWLGHALMGLDQLDAARRALERARECAEELEHDPILFSCMKAQARLHDLQGRFESANDVDKLAQRLAAERDQKLARIRDEMGPMWERYTAERPAAAHPADGVRRVA